MRKTRRRNRGGATSRGLVGVLFKGTQRLPAHVSEETEWLLEGTEVKLTRVFTIVLILHLVAVGGILAFKMIEKASVPAVVLNSSKEDSLKQEKTKAAAVSPAKSSKTEPTTREPLKIERKNPVVVSDPSRKGLSVYRVSNGETLVGIARDLGVSVAELRKLNDLHTGDKLYAGKWLSIPEKKDTQIGNGNKQEKKPEVASNAKTLKAVPVGSASKAKTVKPLVAKPVASNSKATSAPKPKSKGSTYTVVPGDNLYKIARKTGVSYSTLLSLNKLDKPELLQVGQVLKISAN